MRKKSALRLVLGDKPLAYHPCLAQITGKAVAGILLGQLCFWDGVNATTKGEHWDGWFYKAAQDLMAETGLSRSELETGQRILLGLGFAEMEARGVPRTTWYRVDLDKIAEALEADHWDPAAILGRKQIAHNAKGQFAENRQTEIAENRQTGTPENGKLARRESADSVSHESANLLAEERQTVQESTGESTLPEKTKSTRTFLPNRNQEPRENEMGDGDEPEDADALPEPTSEQAVELWRRALPLVESGMTRATFDTHIKPLVAVRYVQPDREIPRLVLATSKPYSIPWIETRLRETVERGVTMACSRLVTIEVIAADNSPGP